MQPDHAPHPCYLLHLIGNIAKTYCAVFSTGCRFQTIMAWSTPNPGFNLWMALNPTQPSMLCASKATRATYKPIWRRCLRSALA